MKAMVAHADITPSINSFLKNNYDYIIENYCHWLGTSFDTSTNLTFTKKNAVMENNRNIERFLVNDILLFNNKLFKLKSMYKDSEYNMEKLLKFWTCLDSQHLDILKASTSGVHKFSKNVGGNSKFYMLKE
jgi:hypothetical protein